MHVLTGVNLTPDLLVKLCREQGSVSLCKDGLNRMVQARRVVDKLVESGRPVYGLTTGLGSKASEPLDATQIAEFSLQAIRGRAHAIGTALPVEVVRAVMLVRINTFLQGVSCCQYHHAEHWVTCLNRGLIPVVGRTGSIGAGDLCLTATLALGLLGEGQINSIAPQVRDADTLFMQHGITVPALAAGDGMGLMNHGSFGVALSTLAMNRADNWLQHCDVIASMSMEAFRANMSPVLQIVKQPNSDDAERRVADRIVAGLRGSVLLDGRGHRRLQDPLSIRNVVQIHGSLLSALHSAEPIIGRFLNSATDNPQVDTGAMDIQSTGAYMTPALTVCCHAIARAVDLVCTMQLARIVRLLSHEMTGLNQYLARPEATSNGFAPVLKIAEALVSEIKLLLAPPPVWPSVNAEGVEDVFAQTTLTALQLYDAIEKTYMLSAIELMVASEAIEQRSETDPIAADVLEKVRLVRTLVKPLHDARVLSSDFQTLAEKLMRNPGWLGAKAYQ